MVLGIATSLVSFSLIRTTTSFQTLLWMSSQMLLLEMLNGNLPQPTAISLVTRFVLDHLLKAAELDFTSIPMEPAMDFQAPTVRITRLILKIASQHTIFQSPTFTIVIRCTIATLTPTEKLPQSQISTFIRFKSIIMTT